MTDLDIRTIDIEHADLMVDIDVAISFSGTNTEKCEVFRRVIDNLIAQFETEELMKDDHYFNFSKHAEVHKKFISAVEDLYTQAVNTNNHTEINDLLLLFRKYLASHFEIADMAFRFFLAENA